MKALRRFIILIIFVLISVTTMVTGVFAWFIDYGNMGSVDPFGSTIISNNEVLQVNAESEEIFLGDRIRDLVYLTDVEFNTPGLDFYGFASVIRLNVENPGLLSANVKLQLNVVAAPEFGSLAGSQPGIKYLVLDENPNMSQITYLTERMSYFQSTNNVFTAIGNHNAQGINIPAQSDKDIYVYIWGSYDGLTPDQKLVYHSLIYRVKVMI